MLCWYNIHLLSLTVRKNRKEKHFILSKPFFFFCQSATMKFNGLSLPAIEIIKVPQSPCPWDSETG